MRGGRGRASAPGPASSLREAERGVLRRRVWLCLWAVAVTASGCGYDPCSDALQTLEDCGTAGGRAIDQDVCEGVPLCTAECINEAECEEIIHPEPDSVYARCVNECSAATP